MEDNWKEQYWKYMVAENFEEAIPLKYENFPTSFFKYRGLTELTIEAIEQDYIWLAEISSLNDPFECSIQFDNDECLREFYGSEKFQQFFTFHTGGKLNSSEIKMLTTAEKPFLEYKKICDKRAIPFMQSSGEQIGKVQKRWTEIVEETNKNLRICSFSLYNSSLLLWSHYASEHKGIAVEYDFIDTDQLRTFMQPVIYRDKVHKVGIFEEYTVMQMIASSLIKSKDWEYEQEWRLTIFRQNDSFPQKMTVPYPKAIYLGTRFNSNGKELRDKLFKIAKQKKIPVFQMVKHPNEFKLIHSL
ncbi:DUF2971 domain-containing protein [Mucilaginibacter sp. BJC16-A38]|uniref:DUF2971 domain-containing protein n=1 Tax=Mucilaginibacter phenanthrenivorans TaxID=1234842 RepID=UPI002157BA6D|nr:DUF2971 domain-containing protein [Mucilaginibacter phenanthrenivorans]MCR8559233.1 DUF2971 domain-containing protein [Mucilaginibacter phenanthrenivorans]